MASLGGCRYVGIIGDGGTDREVLGKVTSLLLEDTCSIQWLKRQSIRDCIDKFWKQAAESKGCGFPGDPSMRLSQAVTGILYGAFGDFRQQIPRDARESDVIVLSSDAEKHLEHNDRYFDNWAWILGKIIQRGAERFYAEMTKQGCRLQDLPSVVSFVPFPSTDVMIAAFRKERHIRARSATELKQQLYGTTNLRELPPGDFQRCALAHITPGGLPEVYRRIPEARSLLRFLALARC